MTERQPTSSFRDIIIQPVQVAETLPVVMYLMEVLMQAPITRVFPIQTLPGSRLRHLTWVLMLNYGMVFLD